MPTAVGGVVLRAVRGRLLIAETYLNDAMNNIGDMLDYAVNDCGYDIAEFFDRFIVSGIAEAIEKGNPKYIAGFSGTELAAEVLFRTQGQRLDHPASDDIDKSPEYWTGWIQTYYQWHSGDRFSDLKRDGLDVKRVLSMYNPYHEADISKFVTDANNILRKNRGNGVSNLQRIRKLANMTQKELANASGVSLRMIQLYEQRRQDVRKAEAASLLALAGILGCKPEDLLESEYPHSAP